jgi:hypothetical protein
MKKTLSRLIIILIVFSVQTSLGQEKINYDYIIKKEGDTIYGSIEYQKTNLNLVKFRNLKNEIIGSFTPENIRAFKTNNDSYLSAKIQTDQGGIKTVFLQNLVEGDKSLYSHEDSNKGINYYIKQNEKYLILVYKSSENLKREENKFKGQLLYYLMDCSSIKSIVNSSSYNTLSLVNVFKKYYECIGVTAYHTSKKRIKIEKGIFIGASISSLTFDHNKSYPYLTSKYESSTDITFGVYLEVFVNKNKGWSVYNEIQYYSYKTSNQYLDIENENIYTAIDTKISHSFIKINNLARYNLPMANQSMYFNIGITNGFVITEENFRRTDHNVFSTQLIHNDIAIPFPTNHEFGGVLGVGTKFNKLSVEARYETTNGVSSQGPISKSNKFYFLIGYSI